MTYNILNSGGIDPQYDDESARYGFHGNRVEKILQIVHAVSPDILGIQEAASWQKGEPPFIEQFADLLDGMGYFLAQGRGVHHVALLSKLPMVELENLAPHFSRSGLRARVLAGSDTLTVIAVHLHPEREANRSEMKTLLRMLAAIDGPALVLGDFNQGRGGDRPLIVAMTKRGWHKLSEDVRWGLDQIWGRELSTAREIDFATCKIPAEVLHMASDHAPAAIRLELNAENEAGK